MIKSRRVVWEGHIARMERRDAYGILVGKPEGRRSLGRRRRRWVDNIKIDLRERVLGRMNLIDLTQNRDQWRDFVNTVINFRVA
jgi:hypothetical protein